MATGKEVIVSEDNLVCSICLEIYNQPRTLPCLHSFCHDCLAEYVERFVGKTEFPCPLCRTKTKLDLSIDSDVKQWVETYPVNFNLVSILTERKETKMETENVCDPCLKSEETKQAVVKCIECQENYCIDCQKHHINLKATSHHTLQEHTCATQQIKYVKATNLLKCIVACPCNASETVEYYCKDHDIDCCIKCAFAYHRKCDEVVTVVDLLKQAKTGPKNESKLDVLETRAVALLERGCKNRSSLEDATGVIQEQFKTTKTKLDEAYNNLEETIVKSAKAKTKELLNEANNHEEAIKQVQNEIADLKEKQILTTEFGQDLHVYLLQKQQITGIESCEKRLMNLVKKNDHKRIALTEPTFFGDVMYSLTRGLDVQIREDRDFKRRNAKLAFEVTVVDDLEIRNSIWLGNYIVVANGRKTSLHMIEINSHKVICTYSCKSSARSICATGENTFCVCVPNENKILMMVIEDSQIRVLKSIPTPVPFHDMTYCSKTRRAYALSRKTSNIYICDLDGNQIEPLQIQSKAKVGKGDGCICLNKDMAALYITSFTNSKVHTIVTTGQLVSEYTYEHLRSPTFTTCDPDGNIYIPTGQGKSIHQVDKDGGFIREILPTESAIKSICFNEPMTQFAITVDRVDCPQLKVYTFE